MPDPADTGEKLELDQSAAPADTATADPALDDNNPAPSGGEGAPTPEPEPKEPQSMAEAIEAALEAAPDGEAPKSDDPDAGDADDPDADAASKGEGEDKGEGDETPDAEKTEPKDKDGDDLPDDPTDDELKGASPRAQKRIAKLLSQRKEARLEADALRPDAENYRAVRTFMTENQLEDKEVAQLFQAGAALKSGTPEGMKQFLEIAGPMVQMALEATGQALPADLQAQVDVGDMTEEAARTVAQSRHTAAAAQAQAQRAQAQVQSRQQVDRQTAIANAVGVWTQRIKSTDPDFDRKADAVKRVSQALVAERGLPRTPEEATAMAQEAYDEATRLLRAANPPRPTRPQPSTSHASTHRSAVKSAPQSLSDIVSQGLGL